MGKGLIPADVETWKVRRKAIVPGFHKSWLNAMVRILLYACILHAFCPLVIATCPRFCNRITITCLLLFISGLSLAIVHQF